MTASCLNFDLSAEGLERAIEPLASYICAADQPRAALRGILSLLFNEVQETNQAALAHFGSLTEGR